VNSATRSGVSSFGGQTYGGGVVAGIAVASAAIIVFADQRVIGPAASAADQPGVGLATGALGRIALQKTLFAIEQLRPKIARRREQWKKYQGRLDPKRLVFMTPSAARRRAGKS